MPQTRFGRLTRLLAPPLCLALCWWLSTALVVGPDGAPPKLWLAVGVYFGFVIATPRKGWPLLVLAAILADVLRFGTGYRPMMLGAILIDSAVVLLSVAYLRRKLPWSEANPLYSERGLHLLVTIALVAPAVAVGLFRGVDLLLGAGDRSAMLLHYTSWALGVLVTAPLVFSVNSALRDPKSRSSARVVVQDALALIALFIVALGSARSELLPAEIRSSYLAFPVMIWIALRGRVGLTAAANFLLATLFVFHFELPQGLAQALTPSGETIHLQFIVGTITLVSLLLTMTVAERRRVTEEVRVKVQLATVNRELASENQLRKAAQQAASEASRTKSRFLAAISHEVRTPLGAMLGFADLSLEGDGLSAEKRGYIEIISRNGRYVRELLDQILDLAKIEAGRLEVSPAPLVIRTVVDDVAALMGAKARERGLRLEVHVSDRTPHVLITDSMRLREILINAIGNALKFTERGYVKLWVDAALGDTGRWRLRCEIEDTGTGLSPEECALIFHDFAQANAQVASRYGGTGLGLTLSRHMARLMGGDFVLLKTEKGVGSVFGLTVDGGAEADCRHVVPSVDGRGPGALAETPAAIRARGLRVLLADDASDIRLLARRIFEMSGVRVDEAKNGREAVELARANDYHVVLMDLQMPEVDGLGALRTLKSSGFTRPIIALTGSAMPDEIEACLAQGFDGHLAKPLDRRLLIETVVAAARGGPVPFGPLTAGSPAAH